MPTIGWFVLALFIGAALGALAMGLLAARGPCVDDAIHHLGILFWLVDNAEMCDFRTGVTHGNIDEGAATARRILANVERYLLSVGDEYVTDTRGTGCRSEVRG